MVKKNESRPFILVILVITIYIASCLIGNLLGQFLSEIVWGKQFVEETPYINSLISSLFFGTSVAIVIWKNSVWRWKNCALKQIFATSLLLFVGEVLSSSFFLSSIVSTFGLESQMASESLWKSAGGNVNLLLQIVCVVVLTPIAEEIVFRGAVFGFLREKYSFFFSAVLSSILFSLIHGVGLYTLSTFIMGMFFCLAYEKTNSLLSCVLIHMVNNLIGVISIIQTSAADSSNQSGTSLVFGIIALAVSVLIYINQYKKCKAVKEIVK